MDPSEYLDQLRRRYPDITWEMEPHKDTHAFTGRLGNWAISFLMPPRPGHWMASSTLSDLITNLRDKQ